MIDRRYGTICVRNLDKYQHYKNRPHIWVKVYQSLLDDYEFTQLRDQTKWAFIGLILLAVKMNNRVPADPAWLAARLSLSEPISIIELQSAKLIVLDMPKGRPPQRFSASTEESRVEQSRGESSPPPVSSSPAESQTPTEYEDLSDSTAESDFRSPLLFDPPNPNGKRAALKAPPPRKRKPAMDPALRKRLEEEFDDLYYEHYPRHDARQESWEEYVKLQPDADLLSEIKADIAKRKRTEWKDPIARKEMSKILLLSTYLHKSRWDR